MSALHAGATSFQPSTRTSTSPVRPPLDRVDGAGAAAFYPLHCLPFLPCDHGDSDAVLDSDVVKFACDDVSALLRMPYAHFLSLVVFHKGVRTLVDTFLQHRRRSYETIVRQCCVAWEVRGDTSTFGAGHEDAVCFFTVCLWTA